MWNALLQPSCLGCGQRPGPLCSVCADAVAGCVATAEERDGLLRVWAAPHEPPMSRLVVALKEHGARALTPLLAAVLAVPLDRVVASGDSISLMPIPQRRRNSLRRPEDPVARLAVTTADLLGGLGKPVSVTASLSWVRGGPDQSRLAAAQRRGNVSGALRAAPGSGRAVLVDDVVTTGATALEAARAARGAGWLVHAVVSLTHPAVGG